MENLTLNEYFTKSYYQGDFTGCVIIDFNRFPAITLLAL